MAWGSSLESELTIVGFALLFADHVEEELVDASVVSKLRMKGCGEQVAFADEDGVAIAAGQGFYRRAGSHNARGADKDHLKLAAGEL